ncbi:MAG: tetratricopeptide repeat protein, partial [Pseudolabrys sp.]|nr:tetratricopeptide repeat protein [Pseudolabrys sp.]
MSRLLDDRPVRAAAWRRRLRGCRLLAIVLALAFAGAGIGRAGADEPVKGEVRVVTDNGFTRLVFRLDEAVDARVRLSGAILVINFKKPVAVAVDRINAGSPDYISAARSDPDGSAVRIALARKVRVNAIPAAERLYVDLLPDNWTGTMPGLPQEVVDELASRVRMAERQLHKQRVTTEKKPTPTIRVKVVKLPTFMRYVFDLPERTSVTTGRTEGKLSLNFDQQINWDLADAVTSLPKTLESIGAETEFDRVAVVFQLNGTPEVRSFREDGTIVVDVALGESGGSTAQPVAEEGASHNPAGSEGGPAIAPPETVPAKDSPQLKEPPAHKATPEPIAAP